MDALEEVKAMAVPIGGEIYVQSVYNANNIGASGLNQGQSVQFQEAQNTNNQPYPSSVYNPYAQQSPQPYANSQYQQPTGNVSQYMNSQYVSAPFQPINPSQYMNSQYISQYIDQQSETKKNNAVKGIIIGLSAVVVAAIIITVCVVVVKQNSQPVQPQPPFGGQMQPGGMPQGAPGAMPQNGAAQGQTP
jgi:hypothetical protein